MRSVELKSQQLDAECVALSFRAKERLSQEPSYELELVSPRPDLDLEALLGDELSVRIDLGAGESRSFHAYVFGGADTGQLEDNYTYKLELHSWLSFLLQNRNCRIFQDLTVLQIVEQVFAGHHRADYRLELEGQYMPREYCVQFRESDLNFVKRLLEDEGLYFYVEHEADRHVVVISDTQRFEDLPSRYARLRFLPDGEEHRAIAGREGVQRLQRTRKVSSNNVVLRDFDYFAPSKSLQVDAQMQQDTLAGIQLEHYDYGAGYQDPQRGEWLAQLRLESMQAEAQLLQGEANAMGLSVGRGYVLEGHPDERRNRRFYVVSTQLAWLQDGPQSASSGRNFVCSYLSLADDQPFRPLRLTPRPEVPGTHSATVVGPPGAEVHTDKLARIRVHFHWDRYKSTEEDASCWMRISHAWAGKGWGFLAMPRVGQEVLITYIDGDLDRPLAVGIVYNGENPVPYDLPKDIRYSGMVTRSLKHGQVQHASQITFDDQRGAERVMVHAERDLQETVERNKSTAVGHYMNLAVSRVLTITTGGMSLGGAKSSGAPAGTAASGGGEGSSSGSSGVTVKPVSNSVTGVSNALTGMSNSATGVSTSITGLNASLTGMIVSLTGVSISFTGLAVSFTGISTSFTGLSTSFTGLNTSFTGVSTSFTGASTSFTGISTSFVGVGTSFTGTSTSMTGVLTSLTGAATFVTGTSTSMTGISQSMTGDAISMTGQSRSMTGVSYSSTGHATSETGVSISSTGTSHSRTGVSVSETGVSTSTTGTSTSTTGTATSITGTSTSNTGTSTSMTGTSTSMTGSSTTMTGASNSTVGSSISQTGLSNSTTGVSISFVGVNMARVGIEIKSS